MKHFCYILRAVCANLLKRFIFAYMVRRNTKIPPGFPDTKIKRFNKYPVVVCACVHTCIRAHVRMGPLHHHRSTGRATRTQAHGLLKRFTAKMPLCNCLTINEIKYFFKFFLQLKKISVTLPSAIGKNTRRRQEVLDIRKHRKPKGCLYDRQAGGHARNDLAPLDGGQCE